MDNERPSRTAALAARLGPLANADPDWLARLITRRLPLEERPAALEMRSEDIESWST